MPFHSELSSHDIQFLSMAFNNVSVTYVIFYQYMSNILVGAQIWRSLEHYA